MGCRGVIVPGSWRRFGCRSSARLLEIVKGLLGGGCGMRCIVWRCRGREGVGGEVCGVWGLGWECAVASEGERGRERNG